MEFQNIQLPAFVVAGLYKHSLVLVEDETVVLKLADGILSADDGRRTTEDAKPITVEQTPTVITKQPVNTKAELPSVKIERPVEVAQIPITDVEIKSNIEQLPDDQLPSSSIKYLGGFSKKISVVVAEHFQPHISDGDLAFLGKLLQACHLSLNDVAIINVVSNAALSNRLWQLMPAEKMIMFDVDPGTLGIPFRSPNFQVQPWNDCLFLTAPSLRDLQEGPPEKLLLLKRKLWDSLKKMFAL